MKFSVLVCARCLSTPYQNRENFMNRPTIKDIAEDCDVSLSTVSLVLNGNPRISDKTKERVLAAVEKLGYQPNIQARGLASRSSMTLGVVVPALDHVFADIYFGEIISGIYDQAVKDGYKVLLDIANDNFIKSNEHFNILQSRRVDGLLFVASSIHDDYLKEFEGRNLPFLLVNHYYPGSELNTIMLDYKDSARLAADYLTGLGHSRIGLIAGTNTYTGLDFRTTFVKELEKRHIPESQQPILDGGPEWSQEEGFEAAKMLMEAHPELTAIMAGNDRMALGALRYLLQSGRRVPQDVSVMGVDDITTAYYSTPQLTTIHHPLYEIGKRACQRVQELFKKELVSCKEIIPVHLVERESTAPPPA